MSSAAAMSILQKFSDWQQLLDQTREERLQLEVELQTLREATFEAPDLDSLREQERMWLEKAIPEAPTAADESLPDSSHRRVEDFVQASRAFRRRCRQLQTQADSLEIKDATNRAWQAVSKEDCCQGPAVEDPSLRDEDPDQWTVEASDTELYPLWTEYQSLRQQLEQSTYHPDDAHETSVLQLQEQLSRIQESNRQLQDELDDRTVLLAMEAATTPSRCLDGLG